MPLNKIPFVINPYLMHSYSKIKMSPIIYKSSNVADIEKELMNLSCRVDKLAQLSEETIINFYLVIRGIKRSNEN